MKAMCALRSSAGQLAIWYGPPPGVFIISMYFTTCLLGWLAKTACSAPFDGPHPGRSWCSRSRIRELYMPSSGSGRSRGRAASGTIVAAKTVGHAYAGLEIVSHRVDSRVHRPDVRIGSVGSSQRLPTPRCHRDGHGCAAGWILRVLRGRSSASRALTAENVPQPAVIAAHEIRTHLINGVEAPRAARRPSGKARRPSIPGVFEGGATLPDGMHRRPNAGPIYEMGS